MNVVYYRLLLLIVIAVVLLASDAQAQTQPATLPQGVSLLPADLFEPYAVAKSTTSGQIEIVNVDGRPFTKALRITVTQRPANPWDVEAGWKTVAAVQKDDVILVSLYARALEAPADTLEGRFNLNPQGLAQSWERLSNGCITVNVGEGWKQYYFPFKATKTADAGAARIGLAAGYDPQVIELGGMEAINYGQAVKLEDLPCTPRRYSGQNPQAPWRDQAHQRIEQIRKADLTVRVVGPDGKPKPGVDVEVSMQRHAFPFGTVVVAEQLLGTDDDSQRYRHVIARSFNRAVFEFEMKWPVWDNRDAAQQAAVRERVDRAVDWLEEQGLSIRGHCLVWPSWKAVPADLKPTEATPDHDAIQQRIRQHIQEIVGRYAGRLVDWDVINEPWSNHDLMDLLGREVMVDWFKWAREADPKARLYLNDYTMLSNGSPDPARVDAFYDNAKFLIDHGAPIDGIGEQAHFRSMLVGIPQMMSLLDRFAQLGLPIQITEFDANVKDPQLQAEYLRDFYTAAFSHPSINGIVMWGFWAKRHWLPDAALWRKDWTIKPAGEAYLELVTKQWWTQAQGQTDQAGEFTTRGFLGDYQITVTDDAHKTTVSAVLPRDGTVVIVRD